MTALAKSNNDIMFWYHIILYLSIQRSVCYNSTFKKLYFLWRLSSTMSLLLLKFLKIHCCAYVESRVSSGAHLTASVWTLVAVQHRWRAETRAHDGGNAPRPSSGTGTKRRRPHSHRHRRSFPTDNAHRT